MRPVASLVLALALASTAAAQLPVALTGKIERAGANPCHTSATHRVACTDIFLRSTTVDLSSLEGRTVDLRAVTTVTPGCAVLLDVTEAANAAYATSTLALGGYRRNATVVFTTTAPVGALVAYFFASQPGFLPFLTFGTLQLDPTANFLYWTFDVSIGVALRTVRIPDEPALVGQVALFQTAFVSVAPELRFGLLNAGCFTIQ
ncbi:MAG TPA: hypothetical protein VK081_10235 [Planctomycetota bacterium]|nr:hypothetical protein [Planctomycetota bacterium]